MSEDPMRYLGPTPEQALEGTGLTLEEAMTEITAAARKAREQGTLIPHHPLEAPSPWAEAALAVDGALDYFHTLHEAPTALRAAFRIQMAVNDLVRAVRLSLPPVSLDGLHEPVEVQSES